jgi:hypothetical protein
VRRAPVDESQFVHLTLDADAPGVYFEALTAHPGWMAFYGRWRTHIVYGQQLRWHPLCHAPCSIDVPATLVYRVAGPNVSASDEFSVGPPASSRALHVRAGSRRAQAGGAVSLGLGIPTAVVGVILISASHETRTAGYVTGGIGVGLVTLGAVLLATSATNVYDEEGRVIGAAPAAEKARPTVALSPSGLVF